MVHLKGLVVLRDKVHAARAPIPMVKVLRRVVNLGRVHKVRLRVVSLVPVVPARKVVPGVSDEDDSCRHVWEKCCLK